MFNFYLNTKVKFGCGVSQLIAEVLQTEKWNRIGVVVDHTLSREMVGAVMGVVGRPG